MQVAPACVGSGEEKKLVDVIIAYTQRLNKKHVFTWGDQQEIFAQL
jgi:N-acetylglutamate synthase-like GNAT family acetyltransferase